MQLRIKTIYQLYDLIHKTPWVMETIKYLRKVMDRRDAARMENELVYLSYSMKNRSAEFEDNVVFCI